jgi:hypothetical protein
MSKPKSQRKFGPELWKDVVEEKMDELPHRMAGLAKYSIENIRRKS